MNTRRVNRLGETQQPTPSFVERWAQALQSSQELEMPTSPGRPFPPLREGLTQEELDLMEDDPDADEEEEEEPEEEEEEETEEEEAPVRRGRGRPRKNGT